MEEVVKRVFKRGDFLKKTMKPGSFMIYEGNNISESAYNKKMTLVCFYDPKAYVKNEYGAYVEGPELKLASKKAPCESTVDTEEEDYYTKICNEEEKQEAIKTLAEYGYHWNEETFELVDIETGEIVRKLLIPDDKYHGQIVRPVSTETKKLIKRCCIKKLPPSYNYNSGYGCYDGCYDD